VRIWEALVFRATMMIMPMQSNNEMWDIVFIITIIIGLQHPYFLFTRIWHMVNHVNCKKSVIIGSRS